MTALGVEGISAFSVSRITKELNEKVEEFLSKPIEYEIAYIFIDATSFKIRDGLHYENKILFIISGVRDDGYREILGTSLADSEDSPFWQDLFDDLKERGLRGVKLIVSDRHKGTQTARLGILERFKYDVMNYMQFPQSHWRKIRTTNVMERTNKEIKRRSKIVGVFSLVHRFCSTSTNPDFKIHSMTSEFSNK